MKSLQFGLLFYCILLFVSCSNSKEARKKRPSKRSTFKKTKVDVQNKNLKPKETLDKSMASIVITDSLDWSTTYDSLLLSMDSLSIENTTLRDRLEKCNQRQSGTPSRLDVLWSKFLESFKVDGNQAKKVVFNNKSFDTYIVNVAKSEIQFYWQNDKKLPIKSLDHLAEIVEKEGGKKLVFGTNAGMYTPSNAPQGLFIQNGEVLQKIDRRKGKFGNFYMQPNGVFLIDTNNIPKVVPTSSYKDEYDQAIKFATQSGPMVVIEGEVNKIFKKDSKHLNIRSGVGIIDSAHVVFVISNKRVSFYDFAHVFKENFNCDNALYLDGAISEMYLPELKRFQNGGNFGPMIGVTKKH